MQLHLKNLPNIEYEKGDCIVVDINSVDNFFQLYIAEELTVSDNEMSQIALHLNNLNDLTKKALAYLKINLEDDTKEYHDNIIEFFDFHKEELKPDILIKLFGSDTPEYDLMFSFLKIKKINIWKENEEIQYIMDYSFGEDYTDEVLAVYFDSNENICFIAQES